MRMNKGIKPKGSAWKEVAYLPEWIVWMTRISEDACLIKVGARMPRKGLANLMVAWNIANQRFFSISKGTGIALVKLRNDFPDLCTEVEDILRTEIISDIPMMPMKKPKTVKDYSPKGEEWFEVRGFIEEGWRLWARDGNGPWYNLKLVSTVNRKKMTYWLAWSVDEKRFANTKDYYDFKLTDIHRRLTDFLCE